MNTENFRLDFTFQYPPFNTLNKGEVGWREMPADAGGGAPMHIYLHIPYCRSKCQFCFYKVMAVGTGAKASGATADYLDLLFREIDLYAASPTIRAHTVRSLYIGGGTPSLLTTAQIEALAAKLKQSFRFQPGFEFNFEAYPDEDVLSPEKLACMKEAGVNRLSFGVQSLNDRIQELNGRPARTDQFMRLYRTARDLKFRSLNLDFMSGMVGETHDSWKSQIDAIAGLAPENVTFYKLEFYLNSRLTASLRQGAKKADLVMSDAEEARLAAYAFDRLHERGGYIPSNSVTLTKTRKFEQVHAKSIWDGEPLLAMGLSSYGIFGDYMYQNTADPARYARQVMAGSLPVARAHHITGPERIARTMVNGVKVLQLSRRKFRDRHGFEMEAMYGDTIDRLVALGKIEFGDTHLLVPRSQAIFADDICREFFLPEHETTMTSQMLRSKIVDRSAHAASRPAWVAS